MCNRTVFVCQTFVESETGQLLFEGQCLSELANYVCIEDALVLQNIELRRTE